MAKLHHLFQKQVSYGQFGTRPGSLSRFSIHSSPMAKPSEISSLGTIYNQPNHAHSIEHNKHTQKRHLANTSKISYIPLEVI